MGRHCFSIKEAARILGVCEKTLRRWIERRELEAVLIGGIWRIPRSVICELLRCAAGSRCQISGRLECQLSKDFPA
jgi:excisionase family DNA binding protein